MASFKALCLAGVASLGATAMAHAADLLLPPPPPVAYAPPPAVGFSGFYLRGDVGEGNLQLRDANSSFSPSPSPYYAPNGNANQATVISQPYGFNQQASVTPQVILGVGVGYQFNSYFRADVTGEYRFGGHYKASEGYAGNSYFDPNGNFTQYSGGGDAYNGAISNGVVLANGYIDLGTYHHVTPYVGAGVGVAFNHFSGVTDANLSYFGEIQGAAASHTNTSLAYAFMAGFAYDLTPNLKLDFGYRYLDMGRINTATFNCFTCNNNSGEVQHYHLDSHDIRLGLRYAFADLLPPPSVLIRKY